MEQYLDPTVQRRRLRIELRRARSERGLTQRQVAEDLGWSPSKLLRIENGQVGVQQTDLRALLDRYQVIDPDVIKSLTDMARASRQQGWSQYRDVLDQEFRAYLSYEESASLLRQSEPLVVPGLLQTEEYARAVNEAYASTETTERDIERQTEARMLRQAILERESPPEMFFILDEAVVRRWVGAKPRDGKVMARQLRRLQELNERPGISIQIMPFTQGFHFGMRLGFTMLEFADPEDDELLFLDNRTASVSPREDEDIIAEYKEEFYRLEESALGQPATPDFLGSIITEMS